MAVLGRTASPPEASSVLSGWNVMLLLGSCADALVDGGAVAGEAFEDLFGGLVPDERLRVGVPGLDPGVDVGGQFFGAAVGGTLQFLRGESGEPSFDELHPRSVG